MPELIHTFTTGKMNKDLDERLVPNGEYRDALNLEISTSDTGNVGSLQNIDGNTAKLYKYLNPSTGAYTSWTSGYINALVGPRKIGEIKDSVNEKIYWFIASRDVSAIAEYDQTTEVVVPILVDKNNILNFSENYLITGINIIEGLLFWTDDQTEPKVINIEDFKTATAATGDFLTHTVFNGRDFIEQDITVIKKAPLTPPTLELAKTRAVDADGNPAIVETATLHNFVIADPTGLSPTGRIPAPIGTLDTLDWLASPYPFYRVGDILTLVGSAVDDENISNEYEVRVEVVSVPPGNTQVNAEIKVLSVPETVQDILIEWSVTLDELPFFEFKFPRFAYRYKYKDGYYSTFSPFTEVAFLPGDFDYETKKGYNLGMVNKLKQCLIKDFVPSDISPDVVEIDLLYKESNSQAVYAVDTFKKDDEIWSANEFNIESETISSILPSNQILRAYDNVPRKAKSQEITANRLIYGNYLQNFNLINNLNIPVTPTLNTIIAHDPTWDCIFDENGNCTGHTTSILGEAVPKTPYKSIKTQRTYQVGVVFEDKYGRQTPVFTSESAARILNKQEASEYNAITVQTDGNAPVGFRSFKYYIKEPSNEYYNLAMDRWYDAEDGNVWISFPSAERNKVDEETFLELKKAHDSDTFVELSARYKVIAISNEAPLFLRRVVNIAGGVEGDQFNPDPNWPSLPQKGYTSVDIKQSAMDDSQAKAILDSTQNQRLLRFYNDSNRSDWYKITSIEDPTGDEDYWRITVVGRFGEDVEFITNEDGSIATGIVSQFAFEDFEDKPEFEGRFFVKLNKDSVLEQYILSNINADSFGIKQAVKIGYANTQLNRDYVIGAWGNSSWFIDAGPTRTGGAGVGFTVGGNRIDIAFTGVWPKGSDFGVGRTIYTQFKAMVNSLETVGGLFRFKEDPDQIIYKILETETQTRIRNYESDSKKNKFNKGSNKRVRYKLKAAPLDSAYGTGMFQGPGGWAPPTTQQPDIASGSPTIEFLSILADDTTFTSSNPGIFETEPKESAELELYYAASESYPMAEYGNAHKLDWHNCYSFANGVESDRIRDDFNAVTIDNGPIVSSILKEPYAEERRLNGLIFSQIFNSVSGVNNLNQFIQAEAITKDLNPVYGSIQKLHTRDTNLVTLCEDKCLRILANKDALFNADGNANVTSNNAVLGQAVPYVGEFGISLHPESFASYGFRAYFTDKNRGVVIRLSADGIEEISRYGMADFFADNLKESSITWGAYNDDKGSYNLALNGLSSEWSNKFNDVIQVVGQWTPINVDHTVVSFKEDTNGWESRKSFSTEGGISLNDRFYTFNNAQIWEHGTETSIKNNFYGAQYDSSVTFLINEIPNSVKKYKTLNYSGSNSREYIYGDGTHEGLSLAEVEALQLQSLTSETLAKPGWYTEYIKTDLQEGYVKQFLDKENKWFQYIKGEATFFNSNTDNNLDSKEFPMQGIGRASSIIGPAISAYNVRVFGDPNCVIYINQPTADDKEYLVLEDCNPCNALTLTGTDQAGLPLTFHLVADLTTNGTLGTISGNQITFTPNVPNYFGPAGSFTYRAFNGTRYSEPATVTIQIEEELEPPVIDTSNEPTGTYQAGDPYSWTNIVATDPDHALSELEWSSPDLPAGFTLTTTEPNNKGIASIVGTVPSGTTSFTLRVKDPDDQFDEYVVILNGVAAALLNLEFVASSTGTAPSQTWTNPTDPNEVVTMAARNFSTAHGCPRGTYRLVANKHVNGGIVVGRFYVGNTGGTVWNGNNLADSFGVTMPGGTPTSPTGDVSGATNIPSATAQGNIDGLGNITNLMYRPQLGLWGTDPNNSEQRFVTSSIIQASGTSYRYSYLQVSETDAQNIAANYADPYNNCYVTFTFEPDTYISNTSNFDTHADDVYFQVFQPVNGVTTELFAGGLGVAPSQCQNGTPLGPNTCDPAQFNFVSFDVCSATFLPGYDPNDPANTDPNAPQ